MKTDVQIADAATVAAGNLVAVAKGAVLLDLQALDLDEIQRLHGALVAEVRRRHADAGTRSGWYNPETPGGLGGPSPENIAQD